MHVTVCVGTRNRGASVQATLQSVLEQRHPDFDIVIVDQSAAADTAEAVHTLVTSDTRVTYLRSTTSGAAAARNVAIAHARGPIIAFTDDDCDVPADWLVCLSRAFATDPQVGLIFGEVRAAPHDSSSGFIPTYGVPATKRIRSPWLKWREGGIGANMAFRRGVLLAVGGFDELLGPGAPFPNGEDGDITYRVLKAGYHVLNTPDAYVVHRGFRTWREGRRLMRRTGYAVGAAYMKHLRLRDAAIIPTLVIEGWRTISWRRLLRFSRHSGLGRFWGYVRGLGASFAYSVDRRRRMYRAPRKL